MTRIWSLRRMKNLGLSNDIIYDVYTKEIRSILEFGAPVWSGGLTNTDSNKIEKVQKKVYKIILSQNYKSYESACKEFNTVSLRERRETLCLNFSKKEVRKENTIFNKCKPKRNTRNGNKKKVEEFQCNSNRFYKSGLPYLSRLLNKYQ